jgi:hypothetical protein
MCFVWFSRHLIFLHSINHLDYNGNNLFSVRQELRMQSKFWYCHIFSITSALGRRKQTRHIFTYTTRMCMYKYKNNKIVNLCHLMCSVLYSHASYITTLHTQNTKNSTDSSSLLLCLPNSCFEFFLPKFSVHSLSAMYKLQAQLCYISFTINNTITAI